MRDGGGGGGGQHCGKLQEAMDEALLALIRLDPSARLLLLRPCPLAMARWAHHPLATPDLR